MFYSSFFLFLSVLDFFLCWELAVIFWRLFQPSFQRWSHLAVFHGTLMYRNLDCYDRDYLQQKYERGDVDWCFCTIGFQVGGISEIKIYRFERCSVRIMFDWRIWSFDFLELCSDRFEFVTFSATWSQFAIRRAPAALWPAAFISLILSSS